ncbi:MAG TPA: metallophosphoesterase [Flavisolibacter sp.]|nr:metallophosphoesterase [Flavisolibacter sp.]
MRNSPTWLILAVLMLLLDFYVFQIIRTLSQSTGARTRSILYIGYWTVSVLALIVLFVLPYLNLESSRSVRSTIFAIIIGLFLAKLFAAVFFLIDDLRRGIQWLAGKTFFRNTEGEQIQGEEKIGRSAFLSWLGLAAGTTLFGSLLYGFSNKYDYRVKKLSLRFNNLPEAFKGLKIVQISDVHSGSFTDKEAVDRGIQKILDLQPDLILFTGDLVNNEAREMTPYMDVFGRLRAGMGVYSVLGNHDYGDYVEWGSAEEKRRNLEQLKQVHASMGWRLLMNEHVVFEREGQRIALLGIENWSAKARFPKYGDLARAHAGTEALPFKILMSHDPSHWDAQVRTEYNDIDLMLSGHTHGMQFGVELPWLKWSPVQYVYRQWAGLYQQGSQKLYVNRGFGFIGYPGRVGILPEITLIELA